MARATTATTSPAATGTSSTWTASANWSPEGVPLAPPRSCGSRADLTANSTKNVIAVWHKPRYSSGVTNYQAIQPLFDDLYEFGVDIQLDGHDHIYERSAPIKSGATLASPPVADPTYGIRVFTVGTGGAALQSCPGTPLSTSQVCNGTTYGVLKLTLHATTYDWVFLPIAGSTFTDAGTGNVHGAPSGSNTAPVAVADGYSTTLNTAKVQAAPGVLSNDSDADGNPLTAVLDVNVAHGTLVLNANGGFTYTPTTGYTGPDSFTYHANDGTANSNVVTVSLTVSAAASAPRGWWQFENNLLDSSGNGNNGTPTGAPTYVAGQVGQALSLNGTTQYATVPDAASLDLTTGMTLSAWIKPGLGATQDVLKKATNGSVNGYELSLASPTSPAGQKVFVRLNQATSGDTYRVNSTDYLPNEWHVDPCRRHLRRHHDQAVCQRPVRRLCRRAGCHRDEQRAIEPRRSE